MSITEWIGPGLFVYIGVSSVFIALALMALRRMTHQAHQLREMNVVLKTLKTELTRQRMSPRLSKEKKD